MSETVNNPPAVPQPALPYETPSMVQGQFAVQVGWVGLRLLSVYLMVQGTRITTILSYLVTYSGTRLPGTSDNFWLYQSIAYVTPFVIDFILGVLLFWYSRPLSQRICSHDQSSSTPAKAFDIMVLTVSGVGLFLIVSAIPTLVIAAANIWVLPSNSSIRFGSKTTYANPDIAWIAPVAQIAIGLSMFLFAGIFAGWWRRVLPRGMSV